MNISKRFMFIILFLLIINYPSIVFANTNQDEHRVSYENGYESGKSIGINQGEVYATKDFYLKLENNWKKHFPSEESIIRDYNLSLENKNFRKGFINGFLEGFSQGYSIEFQMLNNEEIKNKTKIESIPISGGQVKSLDTILLLNIEEGTYYNPVTVKLDRLSDDFNSLDKKFIKASDYYGINISNKSYDNNNKKDIELKFEYYGDHNGGIYKFFDGNWIYLPSKIEDGYIKTLIKPNSFKEGNNFYCVLIDKTAKILLDTRSHWATDEITTFKRRGIVSGYSDRIFKPDNEITKGEFIVVLSKVYNWQVINTTGKTLYEQVINYALNQGFIGDTPDKPFKASDPISYSEVESIMRKITNSDTYFWYNFSSKMLYEKQYRSKSYDNKNNYMTRAECIFMLYTLNEWRY